MLLDNNMSEESWYGWAASWFSDFGLTGPATLAPEGVTFDCLKKKVDSQVYIRDINQKVISTQLDNLTHVEVPPRQTVFIPEGGVLGEMYSIFNNSGSASDILGAIKKNRSAPKQVDESIEN